MMYVFNNIKKYLNDHPLIASVIVFFCIFVFFIFLYANSDGDPMRDDHYFHFKYAHLLSVEGLDVVKNFNWICANPDGCEGGRYPVNLFQISLIPFTYLSDWLMALHIADAFYLSVAIGIIYYTLRKARVKYPLFFALSLFTSSYFTSRMLWGRAFVLPVALVFLEMYFAVNKKYKALFAVSLLHVLWHQNTYFMPIAVVGTVEVARYLVVHKMCWKNIVSTILAIIAGMAFFPGFPHSLVSWMKNIVTIQSGSLTNESVKSIEGIELNTRDFMATFVDEKILLLILILSTIVVLFIYVQQKNRAKDLFEHLKKKNVIWTYALFVFTLVMFLGTIAVSGRFYDFLIPSIFVFCAFVVTLLSNCKKIVIDASLRKFFAVGMIIFVGILSTNTMINIYFQANKFDYKPVGEVSQWINFHSDDGEKIFLLNWSDFTLMFFGNHNNIYATGIEPMALKGHSELLYWKYYNIFNYHYYCEKEGDCKKDIEKQQKVIGDSEERKILAEKENGYKIIKSVKNDFGAKFIVSSSDAFTKTIELHPELIEDKFYVKSDKFKGNSMEFTVFKLK